MSFSLSKFFCLILFFGLSFFGFSCRQIKIPKNDKPIAKFQFPVNFCTKKINNLRQYGKAINKVNDPKWVRKSIALPSNKSVWQQCIFTLMNEKIEHRSTLNSTNYISGIYSVLKSKNMKEVVNSLKSRKVRECAYAIGANDSLLLNHVFVRPYNITSDTDQYSEHYGASNYVSYNIPDIDYKFYSVEVPTGQLYAEEYFFIARYIGHGLLRASTPALIFEPRFLMAVPQFSLFDSSSNSTFTMPTLFLGKDFASYGPSKDLLVALLKKKTSAIGNHDSLWLKPIVVIDAMHSYEPRNVRFKKQAGKNKWELTFQSRSFDWLGSIMEFTAEVTGTEIEYFLNQTPETMKWYVINKFYEKVDLDKRNDRVDVHYTMKKPEIKFMNKQGKEWIYKITLDNEAVSIIAALEPKRSSVFRKLGKVTLKEVKLDKR